MVTMADVAEAAGVSTTTVSHVLNHTRPVNADTTERVMAAVQETGYSQNTIARALARASTQSLGLAIDGLSNPYFIDVIAAVEEEARAAGHTLLLGDTRDDPEQEMRVVRTLVERRVDGLLLAPSAGAADQVLPYLAAQSVPVVLLDRLVSPAFDQIGSENEAPTAELVEHLADRGHRRIALVLGSLGLSTTTERLAGYRGALRRRGLDADEALIAPGGSRRDSAHAATLSLLDLPDPPTAIISANNAMTIGVLAALRERGRRVPEDIALVAFDDFEWADLFAPRLTVIAQPTAQLGRQAVQLLLSRLEEPSLPPRSVRLPATFVHRDSCGCVAQ
jgi:LacI family transcriptional regulator